MTYEEFPPAPQLANAIASYWRFALPATQTPPIAQHPIPPDGAVNLCWLPAGNAVLVGPRVTALRVPVQAGAEYVGVRFLPGAAGPVLGIDVPSIRNAVRPFPDAELAETMRTRGISGLNDLLSARVRRIGWLGPEPDVAELTRRIVRSDGTATVGELTDGLGRSYRQILRRFYQAAGLTPKEFARVRRFRAACLKAVQSAEPRWASVSADAAFADQSHLVREFQDIYGWPPRLAHEYLRRIEHVGVVS